MKDLNRSLFLICYDVSCSNRRYHVHKLLSGYRIRGQKSFFECLLTRAELQDVRLRLSILLDSKTDRAHIFQLDPRLQMEGLGLGNAPMATDFFMIV